MARRVRDRRGDAERHAQQVDALVVERVDQGRERRDVVASRGVAVGQTGAEAVVADHRVRLGEGRDERAELWELPLQLDVRDPQRRDHQRAAGTRQSHTRCDRRARAEADLLLHRLRSDGPGAGDRPDVPVVGAAAAAEHAQPRQPLRAAPA